MKVHSKGYSAESLLAADRVQLMQRVLLSLILLFNQCAHGLALSPLSLVTPIFRNVTFRDVSVKPSSQNLIRNTPGYQPHTDQLDHSAWKASTGPNVQSNETLPKQILVQNGQLKNPDQSHKVTDAIQLLLQAMNRGLILAQQILKDACSDAELNVAALAFKDMNSTGALMRVSTPFILMEIGEKAVYQRMGFVYVPSALARKLMTSPLNSIVWWHAQTHDRYYPTLTEETELLADLWDMVPHDVYIEVNTHVNFALGDSDCALVSSTSGYYSVVSTLVHELMHGMGVYSLIEPDRSGGLQGYSGLFDALLKSTPTDCAGLDATAGCYIFDRQNIHHIMGQQLAGQNLYVAQSKVYNPTDFQVGSSLSHFETQASILSSTLAHSTCRFELTPADVSALIELGWDQCNVSSAPFTWNTEDALLPKALMQQLSGTAEPYNHATNESVHSHTTTVEVVKCSNYWYTYGNCEDDGWYAFVAFVWVFIIVMIVAVLCWWWYPCTPAKYQELSQTPANQDAPANVASLFKNKPISLQLD